MNIEEKTAWIKQRIHDFYLKYPQYKHKPVKKEEIKSNNTLNNKLSQLRKTHDGN